MRGQGARPKGKVERFTVSDWKTTSQYTKVRHSRLKAKKKTDVSCECEKKIFDVQLSM
jgi:hypothetical protein